MDFNFLASPSPPLLPSVKIKNVPSLPLLTVTNPMGKEFAYSLDLREWTKFIKQRDREMGIWGVKKNYCPVPWRAKKTSCPVPCYAKKLLVPFQKKIRDCVDCLVVYCRPIK